jgi:hypothetical protein
MILSPPATSYYNGLTVVLSNPSRFDRDKNSLLTGGGGWYLQQECLLPCRLDKLDCEIRTVEEMSILRSGTKALLLLGEQAMKKWGGIQYEAYTLNEIRGYLLESPLPTLASYLPQDAVDVVDWEGRLNPLLQQEEDEEDQEGEDDDAIGAKSRHGKTRRRNWAFWLKQDVRKLVGIMRDGIPEEPKPKYITYPSSQTVIQLLNDTKDSQLYFDVETNVPGLNITVMSIGLPNYEIYTVPILRYNYTNAYSNSVLGRLFSSLARSFGRNEVVIHNALFDLFITSYSYNIPCGKRIYDTMLAFHRCFPEQEKSLGHVMSWGTYQPYHKDEAIFNPHNTEQESQLWKYNAKDVYGLMLARAAIDKYAEEKPGLMASIKEGNRRIRPYLINTLTGIKYNEEKRRKIMAENDKLAMQYLRIIRLLCGQDILPTSSKQCVNWFHSSMGYKSVKKTKKGNPSLDGDSMYKLLLKYPENVAIKFFLKYRERIKETGSLKFVPWVSLPTTS